LTVRLVEVEQSQLPEIVQVPEPIVTVLVFELLELNEVSVTLKFAALNVPRVKVNNLVVVHASPSVTVIPDPLILVSDPSDFPAVVKVAVAFMVITPV